MIEIQNDDLTTTVDEAPEGSLVVAYFTAPWCGPCRMLKPVLEQLEAEIEGLTVARIDVDSNTELARQFQIMTVPTLHLYKDGNRVGDAVAGIKPKKVLQELFTLYLED